MAARAWRVHRGVRRSGGGDTLARMRSVGTSLRTSNSSSRGRFVIMNRQRDCKAQKTLKQLHFLPVRVRKKTTQFAHEFIQRGHFRLGDLAYVLRLCPVEIGRAHV